MFGGDSVRKTITSNYYYHGECPSCYSETFSIYSYDDSLGLLKKVESTTEEGSGESSTTTQYFYDNDKNLIKKVIETFDFGIFKCIETINYTYTNEKLIRKELFIDYMGYNSRTNTIKTVMIYRYNKEGLLSIVYEIKINKDKDDIYSKKTVYKYRYL